MKKGLVLYTFCVYIGRHTQADLIRCLNLLYKSLSNISCDYKLIAYSNFEINHNLKNLEIRKYYDNSKIRIYHDIWLNLSFNKINIFKDLHNETGLDPVWIDLDTLITGDIKYINEIDNCFIENGGDCETPNPLFNNNNDITIPRKNYIQGNFWKLNKALHQDIIQHTNKLLSNKMIPRYDLQDIFSHLFVYENQKENKRIKILGNNHKKDTINGLAIWSKHGHSHATEEGVNNLYKKDNKLFSQFYPDKKIDILSFTFNTLKKVWGLNKFKEIIK